MRLDSRQLGQLQRALLHSFDRDALRMMVRLQLNENLDAVTGAGDLTTVVFDLITWAERTFRVGELINGALAANPSNPELQQLATDYVRWQAVAPAGAPSNTPVTLSPAPPAPPADSTRWVRWAIIAVAALVVALLAWWLLQSGVFPADPLGPAPVEPTLPSAESPLALAGATATATAGTAETPSPASSVTLMPGATESATPEPPATSTAEPLATSTAEPSATSATEASATPATEPSATPTTEPPATSTPEPSATSTPEPSATSTIEPSATFSSTPAVTPRPPRAPALKIDPRLKAFPEESRIWTVKSGEPFTADMRQLWSAPLGTPVDCASGYIVASWQVRQPYPGGDELEIRRVIPRGGGRTEVLARGARGNLTAGYCDELILHNLGLEDYRLEWRYASALLR